MHAIKMKDDIYWVGAYDKELRIFDIIMETKMGTTYNAYLINDEKVAIVDSVKDGFYDDLKTGIKEVIGDRKVDYLIVQHTELDHSGSLKRLIEDYPEATVVASKAAITYLKGILNREFNYIEACGELCLGKHTLKFISAPNLHWPDTIFTYMEDMNLLFTCDFTGCHYAPENGILEKGGENYLEEMKYYFDVIMGPFKKFVRMALTKIQGLKIDMIAPSHGPIHAENPQKYLDLYKEWSEEDVKCEKNVQIFYISAYHNTEIMAEYLRDSIIKSGVKAEAWDIIHHDMATLVSKVENASAILIGSPTINQDAVKPAWDLLSSICVITNKNKPAAAFGSYGWSGESVPMLTERLKSLKFKVVQPGLKFHFVPSEDDFKCADKLAEDILLRL